MTKFYITTTIPYVNAAPHIGHAQEFAEADTVARYRRSKGDKVYLLSGTDENAIKNVEAAEKAGIPVKDFVAQNSGVFEKLLRVLNVSYGQFIRTTEERHKVGAQALWRATKKEDIYKKTYRGLYCIGCELFYTREELTEDGECHEHPGRKLEVVEEENYFFKLSNYTEWLHELIESDSLRIIPHTRKNEILAFIGRGLEDFSISRPIERSKGWGVPVPGDPKQTIYVWYDALANYITALGYPDTKAELYKEFWFDNSDRVHILGKGVSRFHAIYWPAMLKSAGIPLPTLEFIHGYCTVDGQKMSKTIGNVTNPIDIISEYGADVLRYYLLREISAYGDGDFSIPKLRERYNADLANGLGNLASRISTIASRFSPILRVELDGDVEKKIKETKQTIEEKMKEFRFHEALSALWDLIAFADVYMNDKKPWEAGGRQNEIGNLATILYCVGEELRPFLPETAEKILKNVSLSPVVNVSKIETLFPRL